MYVLAVAAADSTAGNRQYYASPRLRTRARLNTLTSNAISTEAGQATASHTSARRGRPAAPRQRDSGKTPGFPAKAARTGSDSAGERVLKEIREEHRPEGIEIEVRVVHRQLKAHTPW